MGKGGLVDRLNAGTKEVYSFVVGDRLGDITDLSSYTAQYKVMDENDQNIIVDWTDASDIDEMRVDILLDTTNPTPWPDGTYKIYLKVTVTPEVPILGPALVEVA